MRRVLLLVLILLAAYIAYPYLTLYRLNQALLDNNKESLEQIVDFPTVRAGLKSQLKEGVMAKAEEAGEDHPVIGALGEALGKLVAPALVDSTIDAMVTPEAVLDNSVVEEHRKEKKSFVDSLEYAFFSSPTTFDVRVKDPDDADSLTVTGKMALEGLRWRVVEIELPPADEWLSKTE